MEEIQGKDTKENAADIRCKLKSVEQYSVKILYIIASL